MKIKLNKKASIGLFVALAGSIASTSASAVCLSYDYATFESPAINNWMGSEMPPARDTMIGCTGIKTVDTLEGGAASLIQQIKDDIVAAGKIVVKQLKNNAEAELSTISDSTDSILKTMAAINDSQTRDFINLSRYFLDMEMNYLSELKEREVRAMAAPLALNDTQEVYQYILYNLDEEIKKGNNHSQTIIGDMAKAENANGGTIIPVQVKAGENPYSQTGENCKPYDPAVDKKPNECFYGVKDFPADKLSKIFNECSREKRRIITSVKKSSTQNTVSRELNKSQSDFMKVTGSLRNSALNNKIKLQSDISCSITDMRNKFCHSDLSNEEYAKKVINLEIVPNGNISSSNLLSPTPVGSVDGRFDLNMTEEELKMMNLTVLERDNGEVASTNTVPLVNTYRSSSQYVAAKDFVSNIMAKELVPNQDFNNRTSSASALYQTRFLSRAAAMSLAEASMNKSIEARIGKNIREGIDSNVNFNTSSGADGKVVFEDINGAGYLDELADSIHKDYQKIVVSDGGNSVIEEISVMSPEAIKEWQLSTIIRQNEMALMQFEQNERIELLLAAMLSQLTNSAEEIKYLDDVRRQ